MPPSSRRGVCFINSFLGVGGGGSSNGYYQALTVDHTKLDSWDLTNYPVLISFIDANLKSVSNGGHVNRTEGLDIYVKTTSSGSTLLPFELHFYDPTTGQVFLWVRAATVSHTADTTIGYLRYGDTSITTDQSDKATTLGAFRAVTHGTAAGSTSPSGADVTPNAITADLTNSPTAGTTKVYGGVNVAGGSSYTGAHLVYSARGDLCPSPNVVKAFQPIRTPSGGTQRQRRAPVGHWLCFTMGRAAAMTASASRGATIIPHPSSGMAAG